MALPKLPAYMERIRAHLLAERGMSDAKATSTAIATCHVFCSSGKSPNLPDTVVNPASRAEACAAVAELQAMRKPKPSAPVQEAPSQPIQPEPKPEAEPEPAVSETVTEKAWDGSPSRFTDAQYERSCVLDRGSGPVKERYSLPVREPDGTLNRAGVHAAASRIGSVKASPEVVRAAARALVALYRGPLNEGPPDGLLKLAGLAAVAAAASKDQPSSQSRDLSNDDGFEVRTIDVDVDDVDVRGRTIHGYAAVYGSLSHDLGGFRERIAPGAFADVLASEPDVRALLNHDPNQVLGRTRSGTLRLYDEPRGLRMELDLPDSPLGENVREAVRRKDIDGASFRFKVGRDGQRWDGDTRTLVRIDRLLDASIATLPAYPDASVELRTKEEPTMPLEVEDGQEAQPVLEEETRALEGGSLRVADINEGEHVEQRTLLGAFREAGWTPGVRAEIPWHTFEGAAENRSLTWTGSIDNLNFVRRDGVPFGADQRYAWPAFPRDGIDSGVTAVQVMRQTSRTLPDPADVIRDIAATTDKPEAGSTLTVDTVGLKQVAAVQSAVPNIYLLQDQMRSIVGTDLRLSINEALDKLVLDALAAADNLDPASDPLLVSIRKAVTVIQAAGYNPDTVILTPGESEALDVLQTSGSEKFYVFGAARFAPGDLFGLNVRVAKSATEPIVCDASALGRLYASPISLQTFEENFGKTNTSLVRLEGNAVFGTERLDAAVRIAAS